MGRWREAVYKTGMSLVGMWSTSDSRRPVVSWTEVKVEDAETVGVLAEIDLYLAGVARMWT